MMKTITVLFNLVIQDDLFAYTLNYAIIMGLYDTVFKSAFFCTTVTYLYMCFLMFKQHCDLKVKFTQ